MLTRPFAALWVASLAMLSLAATPLAAQSDRMHATSQESATVSVPAKPTDANELRGEYSVVVRGPDGKLIHEEKAHNLVVNQGKNAMLDTFLGRGSAYAGIYFGLITSNTTPVAGDTYASHGFTEAGTSVISARLAPTYGAASGGTKATSTGTTFTLNAAASIYGIMQVLGPAGAATAGDTATSGAILYSATLFTGGVISVPSGSTITVSYSGSL